MTTLTEMLPIILEKSRSKKLGWEALGNSIFIARLGSLALTASSPKGDWALSVVNEDGGALETVRYSSTSPPHDRMIADIYEAARRSALQIDISLEYLKNALDDL